MSTNDDRAGNAATMDITRTVITIPRCSPAATCNKVWDYFLTQDLEARGYPLLGTISLALDSLRHAATYLIGMHQLEGGQIIWETEGLRVRFTVSYGMDGSDDLSPPLIAALPPISAHVPCSLTFALPQPIQDGYLDQVAAGTAKFGLITRIAALAAEKETDHDSSRR